MVAVPINPRVLQWARTERGLTEEEAAKRLKIEVAALTSMEREARELTLGELERIAGQYRIPLASLLMPEPLPPVADQRRRLQDFRVYDGHRVGELSTDTIIAIEEALSFADDLSDLRQAERKSLRPSRLPRYKLTDRPAFAAEQERARLKISVQTQLEWTTDREAFLSWREAVEAQGVFAYQLKLGDDDTRGFAIWDEREIPIVVVDAGESGYQAKTYTLWHEYAHILLRMGGISNQNGRNAVERFCNSFAAYFLMPVDEFAHEARFVKQSDAPWSDAHISRLASRFKVSKSAVAIHLEATGLAHEGLYQSMWEDWRLRTPVISGGRATHVEKLANRLGGHHIIAVLEAAERGTITKLDAYEMMAVKPAYFDELYREVNNRRAAYGQLGQ